VHGEDDGKLSANLAFVGVAGSDGNKISLRFDARAGLEAVILRLSDMVRVEMMEEK
jgi:hypothetical protein